MQAYLICFIHTQHPPHTPSGSGTIDVKELKTALFAIGQQPSDEDVYLMVAEVRQQQQDGE